ncbi:MAG TPA: crossover junction endodeoxyribonuclease RuvC [Candidatus Stackebrandtia faecavium]|nr:crossover junction endodeoxyribonuclease RuvC [Candidatus Stackebrandtia faecavium]
MRVMGIDPGLTRCGVGIVEGTVGRACTLVGVGVARTSSDDPLPTRLCDLDSQLSQYVDRYRPEAVAVERVFSQHNTASVIGTAQASAVAILIGAKADVPVTTYTPSEAKAAITGFGGADKKQMTAMVTRLLRLDTPPKPADAADALALAICHVWRGHASHRLAQAAARRNGTRTGRSGA